MNAVNSPLGVNGVEFTPQAGLAHPMRPGFYDPLADEPATAYPRSEFEITRGGLRTDGQTIGVGVPPEPKVMVEFLSPSQLKDTVVPEGSKLVGDFHIERGSPFVLGGAPGVGKSRAAVALAVAGATGADWFGLSVHRKFRTMILQAENGRVRLKNEFSDLDVTALDGWVCHAATALRVRVYRPPLLGAAPGCDCGVQARRVHYRPVEPSGEGLDGARLLGRVRAGAGVPADW